MGGIDFRRVNIISFFGPTSRGSVSYDTLQRLYDNVATVATINATLPGGDVIWPFKQYDYCLFLQDEWHISRRPTLTYGFRWESPGPSLDSLIPINNRIVANADGNGSYRLTVRHATSTTGCRASASTTASAGGRAFSRSSQATRNS